jgi:hypothetical protein
MRTNFSTTEPAIKQPLDSNRFCRNGLELSYGSEAAMKLIISSSPTLQGGNVGITARPSRWTMLSAGRSLVQPNTEFYGKLRRTSPYEPIQRQIDA